jgi:deoxyribodipyrimidine photolyase-related protein
LMVLSNFATLCGYSPRELTDWFWIAYIDAYDWVVEPNVLGMGTFADGGITATKPYVSGAAYVNRMSDYCGSCRFNPKVATGESACPFTALYWTFLERQEGLLGKNPRMSMPYATLRRKSAAEREALRVRAESCVQDLADAEYPAFQGQE